MNAVAELSVAQEMQPLKEIAKQKGWKISMVDKTTFKLGLKAKDESWYWLFCNCADYPSFPPSWHWFNPQTNERDQKDGIPKGGGYFHSSGVICAPWNRLTYKDQNPSGPHSDWKLGDWKNNPHTGECKTLAAMSLRIALELNRPSYAGRLE